MADTTTHTSAKTSGLSSDPLRGTPAKNRAGWSTTLRATSTKLPTGLENSNSSPDPDLLIPIFAPSCRLLVCEPTDPMLPDSRVLRYRSAIPRLGLTRFREPIRVKRSGSVNGVEIDGKERKALLA